MIAIPDKSVLSSQKKTGTDLSLKDVVKLLPKECFEKNALKAWSHVGISVVSAALGYAAIAYSPWYLLPFAWAFTGTALTGWFVVGHDQ